MQWSRLATDPFEAKRRMGKTNKTDALDAKGLAILPRNGTLPESRMALRDFRTALSTASTPTNSRQARRFSRCARSPLSVRFSPR
jgi:hypothetical protein